MLDEEDSLTLERWNVETRLHAIPLFARGRGGAQQRYTPPRPRLHLPLLRPYVHQVIKIRTLPLSQCTDQVTDRIRLNAHNGKPVAQVNAWPGFTLGSYIQQLMG